MPEHVVGEGECIASIADQYGLFWETVWNHGSNAQLRKLRKDPNILKSGDVVFVPDRQERSETVGAEQRHRFKCKGVPAMIRLRLLKEPEQSPPPGQNQPQSQAPQYPPPKDMQGEDPQEQSPPADDEPRANVPFVVVIDGAITEGQTDEDGKLEVRIPPGATSGRLVVEPGTPRETLIPLLLGHLDPIDTVSGVKQRLANLTFDCGDTTEEETEAYTCAIRGFQRKYGLEDTGEMNDTTRQKLQDVHGN